MASATINLEGPSTVPGAPVIMPSTINSAVNTALLTNYNTAAGAVTVETARAEAAEAALAATISGGAFVNLSASGTVTGNGFIARLAAPGPIGSTTPATGAFTTLTASGAVSGAGFVALLAAPGSIGTTTPSNGAFTTLSANSSVTLAPPPAAVTTTTYTVGASDVFLIFNGGATCTVTLPTVASNTGRILWLKTIAAFTVVSAASDVQPSTSATPGTAILAATAGKYSMMVCNGTHWIIMDAN